MNLLNHWPVTVGPVGAVPREEWGCWAPGPALTLTAVCNRGQGA